MITVKEYLMGRDSIQPLDTNKAINMADLLSRVNWLFSKLNVVPRVSSGYRPESINKAVGGAKLSTHTVCMGIDVYDNKKELAKALKSNLELLEEAGLWLENPDHTNGWVHLDIKQRKNRVFNP